MRIRWIDQHNHMFGLSHPVHASQPRSLNYKDLNAEEKAGTEENKSSGTTLYVRAEKHTHLQSYADKDAPPGYLVRVSEDPNVKLCMQCHAPNGVHVVGSEDIKRHGVYEGMSCMECHDPHSNKVKNEYRNVHLNY